MKIVDATRYNDSLQCLRYYYWRHIRGIVGIEPQLPLLFGIGLHEALAEKYRGKSLRQQLQAFDNVWKKSNGDEDVKRNPQRALETIEAYGNFWGDEERTMKILAIEAPFYLPIAEDLAWTGIVDLTLRSAAGRLNLWDHKTTSMINEGFFKGMSPNHQISGYMWASWQIFAEIPEALWFNAILVHKTKNEFDRRPTTRSEQELRLWREEFINWWHIVRECEAKNHFPRNPDRCFRWGGKGCDYHYLCTHSSIDWTSPMAPPPPEGIYRQEEWDPIRHLRKGKETSQ